LVENGVCHPKLEALGLPKVSFPSIFVEPSASDVVSMSLGKAAHQNPYALQGRLGPVLFDKTSGLRCDRIISVKIDLLKKMDKAGLCYYFYLVGECKGCDRIHSLERKLTVAEFDALWTVARKGECYKSRKKNKCDDALCIYGHKP
jgi:hypothetical protein